MVTQYMFWILLADFGRPRYSAVENPREAPEMNNQSIKHKARHRDLLKTWSVQKFKKFNVLNFGT